MRLLFLPVALAALAASSGACASGAPQPDTVSSDPLAKIEGEQLFRDGEALAARGDLVRAEQYLAAAIRRGYPEQRALPLLMRVCVASSRLGSALQHAAPYLRLHPEDHQLRYLVASVLIGLQRYDEARLELLRVIDGAPEHAGAHYALGVLLRDQYDDEEAARQSLARHHELAPHGLHGAEVAAWLREREVTP
jgi:tetratricopeptide (TPR) repeat protein